MKLAFKWGAMHTAQQAAAITNFSLVRGARYMESFIIKLFGIEISATGPLSVVLAVIIVAAILNRFKP